MEKEIWNSQDWIETVSKNKNSYALGMLNGGVVIVDNVLFGDKKPVRGDTLYLASTRDGKIYGIRLNNETVYFKDLNSKEVLTKEPAYLALHPVLQKVVNNALENQEISNHTPYDTLMLCTEATKIADKLKTRSDIEAFATASKSKQLKQVPALLTTLDQLQIVAASAFAYVLLKARFKDSLTAQRRAPSQER